MTSCAVCSGTLRSDEIVYTILNSTGSSVPNVCASCVNKYKLNNKR